jgi:hypothetical protein
MIKIKAYTILELIVVMIISTLVIAITYKAYDVVLWQYMQFKNNSDKISKLIILDVLLTRDFSESDYVILREERGIDCVYQEKQIGYYFLQEKIIREDQSSVDTFFIKIENIQYKQNGISTSKLNMLVDEIRFENLDETVHHFIYKKVYGADFLMRQEELNVN